MRYRVLTLLLAAALLSGCSQGTADAPEPAETTNAQTTQAETTTEAFVPPPAEYETADNSAEILRAAQEQTEQMRQKFGEDIPAFEPAELQTIIEYPDEMTYSGVFEENKVYGQKRYTYLIRDSRGETVGYILQPENEVSLTTVCEYDDEGNVLKMYTLGRGEVVTTNEYKDGVLQCSKVESNLPENGTMTVVQEQEFDEHGHITAEFNYNAGNKTLDRTFFYENEYDDEGKLVHSAEYADGQEAPVRVTDYEYDQEGREVLRNISMSGSKYDSMTVQSEYFSFGSLRRETTMEYDKSGEMVQKFSVEYSYDDPDHVHQVLRYDENGSQFYNAIYEYKIIDNT